MLILTRKIGETVVIQDKVTGQVSKVRVLSTKSGGQVKLAIDADESILIDRLEIFEKREKVKSYKASTFINSIRKCMKAA